VVAAPLATPSGESDVGHEARIADPLPPILAAPDEAAGIVAPDYELGVTLSKLKLEDAAVVAFRNVARENRHDKRAAAFERLLASLSSLPGDEGVLDAIALFGEDDLNDVHDAATAPSSAYALGRARFRERRFEEARELFKRVGADHRDYPRAQIFLGMSNVELRQATMALGAFGRARGAPNASREERALATLSIARTFYSVAAAPDDRTGEPQSDPRRFLRAVQFYDLVDRGANIDLRSLSGEIAWAELLARDYPHALARLRAAQKAAPGDALEAEVMEAMILVLFCRWDEASSRFDQIDRRYKPVREALVELVAHTEQRNAWDAVDAAVRAPELPSSLAPIARRLLSDPLQVSANARARRLFGEISLARSSMPPGVAREAAIASLTRAAIDARRAAIARLRDALVYARDDVADLLRTVMKLRIDVLQRRRGLSDDLLWDDVPTTPLAIEQRGAPKIDLKGACSARPASPP
jgi:tetratricopeptide (TPR) repeat protein